MSRLALIGIAIVLMVACVATVQAQDEEPADSVVMTWVNNFGEAQALGLSENRVILLDFYTDW